MGDFRVLFSYLPPTNSIAKPGPYQVLSVEVLDAVRVKYDPSGVPH